jgi:hypothetical protein
VCVFVFVCGCFSSSMFIPAIDKPNVLIDQPYPRIYVKTQAMSTTQETISSNVINLRGSTEIVAEFFNFSVNNILYQRGIYPPESFKRVPQVRIPTHTLCVLVCTLCVLVCVCVLVSPLTLGLVYSMHTTPQHPV